MTFLVATRWGLVERFLAPSESATSAYEWSAEPARAVRVSREEAEKLVANHGGYLVEIDNDGT